MIKNIKIGIKISTENFNLLDEIYENLDIIDYTEISIKPNFKTDDLNKIREVKLPYAIHLPNSNFGIDFGEVNYEENNSKFLKNVNLNKDLFKTLNPICYIIHPESGDQAYSIMNLKKIGLKPLAIENMPIKGIRGEKLVGYDINTLELFFKEIQDLELCFDINHAIKAATTKKEDYLEFIRNFLNFRKPILFHIASGDLNVEFDDHLHLDEGDYNITKIKRILLEFEEIVRLTFETPRSVKNSIKEDLTNINIFIKS